MDTWKEVCIRRAGTNLQYIRHTLPRGNNSRNYPEIICTQQFKFVVNASYLICLVTHKGFMSYYGSTSNELKGKYCAATAAVWKSANEWGCWKVPNYFQLGWKLWCKYCGRRYQLNYLTNFRKFLIVAKWSYVQLPLYELPCSTERCFWGTA